MDIVTMVSIVANNYIQYVFGSPLFAGLGFLFMFVLIGIRFNWGLDTYIIVILPFISYMAGSMMNIGGLYPLVLAAVGLVLGIGAWALVRR